MSPLAIVVLAAVALLFFVLPWYLTWRLLRRRNASRRWLFAMCAGPVMGLAIAYAFVSVPRAGDANAGPGSD